MFPQLLSLPQLPWWHNPAAPRLHSFSPAVPGRATGQASAQLLHGARIELRNARIKLREAWCTAATSPRVAASLRHSFGQLPRLHIICRAPQSVSSVVYPHTSYVPIE